MTHTSPKDSLSEVVTRELKSSMLYFFTYPLYSLHYALKISQILIR